MFSSPMNTRSHAGARRLLDEVRDLVAERVDLDDEAGSLIFSTSRSSIRRSKIGSQSLLRAKLSSVMKKLCRCPARRWRARSRSTSSGERRRDLRPCTLMMVQNEHWNGQPRPASKLVMRAVGALDDARPAGSGDRRALDAGQVVHVVVDRLERAGGGVAAAPASSRPSSASPANSEAAEVERLLQVGVDRRQHGEASRRRGSRRCRPGCRASRSGRAMSSARGNWFDCTPTSMTMPRAGARRSARAMRSGRMRVLVSSIASMSSVDVGRRARARSAQSRARP